MQDRSRSRAKRDRWQPGWHWKGKIYASEKELLATVKKMLRSIIGEPPKFYGARKGDFEQRAILGKIQLRLGRYRFET